jgi:hypothetical protein
MRAAVLLREQPHYRREAFCAGLRACGYTVSFSTLNGIRPDDVLLIWNRYGQWKSEAQRFEAAGATVIVAENGFFGADERGRQYYQLAIGHHNGAGRWHVGTEDQWSRLGVELKPWRRKGRKVLVMPQRIIGADGVAMPKAPEEWARETVAELKRLTDRPIEVRMHPGNVVPKPEPDWRDVHAVVTWGSGAGIKAICAGVPVFHEMPRWVGARAARFGIDRIEEPWIGDRGPMLHRLGWLQWSCAEIESGLPFRYLLGLGTEANAGAALARNAIFKEHDAA